MTVHQVRKTSKVKYDNPDRKFFQKKFKKQFFIVTNDQILMFGENETLQSISSSYSLNNKKSKHIKPEFIIPLNKFSSVVDEATHDKRENTFAIKLYVRRKAKKSAEPVLHWFAASSPQERLELMQHVNAVIDQKKQGQCVLHLPMLQLFQKALPVSSANSNTKDANEQTVAAILKHIYEGVYSKDASFVMSMDDIELQKLMGGVDAQNAQRQSPTSLMDCRLELGDDEDDDDDYEEDDEDDDDDGDDSDDNDGSGNSGVKLQFELKSFITEKERAQMSLLGYQIGDTLLHASVKSGLARVTKQLLERKCIVNVKNSIEETPLHMLFSDKNYPAEYPVDVFESVSAVVASPNSGSSLSVSSAPMEGNLTPRASPRTPRLKNGGKGDPFSGVNRYPREEIIDMLLQTGQIPIDAVNKDGNTALALACIRNDFVLAHRLLAKDASPDIFPAKQPSPLHYAVSHGNQPLVTDLLKRGAADPNVTDAEGYTPLDRAVQKFKDRGIVELISTIFMDSNPKVNVDHTDQELLKRYVYLFATNADIFGKKGLRLLQNILDSHPEYVLIGFKEDEKIEVPLIQAIKNKHLETAEIILKYSTSDVVCKPETRSDGFQYYPLHVAMMQRADSIVEFLLNNGANSIQKSGKEQALPMFHAAQFKMRDDLAELLVEKALSNLNEQEQAELLNNAAVQGQTILYFAVQHSGLRFVQKLIEKGANVSVTTEKGQNLLSSACLTGNIDVVKYLIEEKGFEAKGTGKEYYTDEGYPPLHSAAKGGHLAIVQYLIDEKGVDVDQHRHELHMRPIQLACLHGHLEVVKYMIDKGGDLNVKLKTRDDAGVTCLHLAAGYGFPKVVELLLANGMDITQRTETTNSSALDFALRRLQFSVVKVLCDHGSVSDSVTMQLAVQTGDENVLRWVEAIHKEQENKED